MPVRLSKEEVVTIRVLAEKGQNHCAIGRTVGVSESTVRYHLQRAAAGAEDGRRDQPQRAETLAEVIVAWHAERPGERRPVNVMELCEHLVTEHDYPGSYQSVRRFVRRHYPRPRMRTYRRVETVPGAQSQTDWAEYPRVEPLWLVWRPPSSSVWILYQNMMRIWKLLFIPATVLVGAGLLLFGLSGFELEDKIVVVVSGLLVLLFFVLIAAWIRFAWPILGVQD